MDHRLGRSAATLSCTANGSVKALHPGCGLQQLRDELACSTALSLWHCCQKSELKSPCQQHLRNLHVAYKMKPCLSLWACAGVEILQPSTGLAGLALAVLAWNAGRHVLHRQQAQAQVNSVKITEQPSSCSAPILWLKRLGSQVSCWQMSPDALLDTRKMQVELCIMLYTSHF